MKEKSPYPQIDKLRAKFDAGKPLNLREVCFVLWAEQNVCSAQYLMFAHWVKGNKLGSQKLKWPLWKALFETFAANDYPKLKDDLDLVLKVQRMGTDIVMGKKVI
jgi:hypothetical protein